MSDNRGSAARQRRTLAEEMSNKCKLIIDHGSTTTRVMLYNPYHKKCYWVMEDPKILAALSQLPTNNQHWFAAHSGILTDRRMSGEAASRLRQKTCLKTLALVLDKDNHDILKLMPNGMTLWEMHNDRAKWAKLLLGAQEQWIAHFMHILDMVIDLCGREGLEVDGITVTLPDWSNNCKVDKIYLKVIHRVFGTYFNIPMRDIKWVSEAQAVAHAIAHKFPEMLAGRNAMCVLDLGGTFANASTVDVQTSNDGITIAELLANGRVAGGEIQEMGCSEKLWVKSQYSSDEVVSRDEMHSGMLDQYRLYRQNHDPTKPVTYSDGSKQGQQHQIELTAEEHKECYDKAYKEALDMFIDMVKKAAEARDGNVLAAVSGGSTLNAYLRNDITARVKKLQAEHPGWTHEIRLEFTRLLTGWDHQPGINVLGAALATVKANGLSLQTMIDSGATFGVQYYEKEHSEHGVMEESIPLLGKGVRDEAKQTFKLLPKGPSDTASLRVICDAFKFTMRPEEPFISPNHTWDVLCLPLEPEIRCNGDVTVRVRRDDGDDYDAASSLVLEQTYIRKKGPPLRVRRLVGFPTHVQTGSCCLLEVPGAVATGTWTMLPGSNRQAFRAFLAAQETWDAKQWALEADREEASDPYNPIEALNYDQGA